MHVLRPLHKTQGNPVGTHLQRQIQVAPVLRRECRKGQHHARHVHALALGQLATHHHAGSGKVRAALFDHEPQAAVIEQQFGAGHQRGKNLGVGHAGPLNTAGGGVQVQAKSLTFNQHHRAFGKSAHAQLGALQVSQDANGAPGFDFQFTQHVEAGAVISRAAVAEVQPKDIHTGKE